MTKVVGGMADALAAGDVALAAQILWLSLKLIWQKGVAAINEIFSKVVDVGFELSA